MDLHTYLKIYGPELLDAVDTGVPGIDADHPLRDRILGIMNAAPPPSDAAHTIPEAYILRALDQLSEDLGRRFGDINARLDKMEGRFEAMVSKDAFEAEVKRLDREAEIKQAELEKLWAARRDDKEAAQASLAVKDTRFRWFVATGITLAAVASAVVFGVLNLVVT